MSFVPLFLAAMVASTGYALWRGGSPERVMAAAFLLGVAASSSLGLFAINGGFARIPERLFAIDVTWAIIFIVIAVMANRLWTIVFAACQLTAVLVHVARLAAPEMIPTSYAFLTVIWSWPMIILLVVGTRAHQARLRRGQCIPPWKVYSRLGELTNRI